MAMKVNEAEFEEAIRMLVGKECCGFAAGAPTGSVLSLDIGSKIRRRSSAGDSALAQEREDYESEFKLLVECSWRLDSDEEIVCGGWDDNRKDGVMLLGLGHLIGQRIESVHYSMPAFDLELGFNNGLKLRIFCDVINLGDQDDNYSLFLPDTIYIVGTRSRLIKEPRSTLPGSRRQH